MANSSKLAEVVALLTERDQEFRSLRQAAVKSVDESGEPMWSLRALMEALEVSTARKINDAVNRAKIATGKADLDLGDHFVDGTLFQDPGGLYLSKYAAYLVVMNCDPSEGKVGLAQLYFTLQLDRQRLEDEKRLKARLDVATEQNKLTGIAKDRGVSDFKKFHGMGIQGLYGGLNVSEVRAMKGLPPRANHLDFAGSEELAANFFRITQTRAALQRQGYRSEDVACTTHKTVAKGVRDAILAAGNTPPEQLPAADLNVDRLATVTKKKISAS